MILSQTTEQPTSSTSMLRHANNAIGHFFFRCRNALFPMIFAIGILVMRPKHMGTPWLERRLIIAGIIMALTGQLIRAITIGFEYIERGGKNKRVYASHLVQGGMYGLTRNPMYIGNVLIAIGVTMVASSPAMYLIALPFFLFVYQSIIGAEEGYLRSKFGADYDQYCARVPRFLPRLRHIPSAFAGMRYQWKLLRKELSTIAALAVGLTLLPLWRTFFLEGWEAAKMKAPVSLGWAAVIAVLYGFLVFCKRRRWLFY